MNNSEQLAQQLLEQLNATFAQAVQAIRTQAYEEGYRAGSKSSDSDLADNNAASSQPLTSESAMVEMDLGLPSGTIWLCPKDMKQKMPIQQAMQCGLKLPTEEQIEELLHCRFFGYVFRKPFVLGANGVKYTLADTVIPCALISATDEPGSDLCIRTRLLKINHEEKSYEWLSKNAFLGEPVRPLFVR